MAEPEASEIVTWILLMRVDPSLEDILIFSVASAEEERSTSMKDDASDDESDESDESDGIKGEEGGREVVEDLD